MTYEAILKASDDQLKKDLNLTKLGDRLSLRSFCERRTNLPSGKDQAGTEEETTDAKKRRLLEELEKKRKVKLQSKESTTRPEKSLYKNTKVTRKIELAWLHKTKCDNMKLVRLKDGGGTRNVDIAKSATKTEIIEIAKKLFFKDGKCTFGPMEQLEFNLLTFDKEPISGLHIDSREVPFTLQAYINLFKLSKIRLYLCTETKEDDGDLTDDSFESDSGGESFINISLLDNPQLQSCNEEHDIQNEDGLIGSSKQRQNVKELIDDACEESLYVQTVVVPEETDHREEESRDVNNLKMIRNERLPKEPCPSDPHYVVSVRHLSLGVLTRRFSLDDFVYSIYDWIGSFPDSPEHFQLCTYSGDCLSPSDGVKSVDKCMLVMVPSMEPVIFSPHETVSLRGFGPAARNSLKSVPDGFILESVSEHCPPNFMQNDDEEESNGNQDEQT